MSTLKDISTADLDVTSAVSGGTLTVTLVGSAESEVIGALETFLDQIHAAAVAEKAPEVVVDMRRLEFINSACLKTFVVWVNVVKDAPAESQYKVRFLSDPKKHWQSRSLSALACFAPDLIRVET